MTAGQGDWLDPDLLDLEREPELLLPKTELDEWLFDLTVERLTTEYPILKRENVVPWLSKVGYILKAWLPCNLTNVYAGNAAITPLPDLPKRLTATEREELEEVLDELKKHVNYRDPKSL